MNNSRSYLHNDDGLEISHTPGSGRSAVVSFAGVGLGFGGLQTLEFSKSLDSSTDDIYFVKDKVRHWYAESADRIADVLNRSLRARNIESAACIGNSMGGFGAIYFASRLFNCRNAVAFVPQSSVNTAIVPWEPRWMEWRSSLAPGTGLDSARGLAPTVSYSVVAGLQNRYDILHAKRLIEDAPDSLTVIGLSDSGHGAAAHLKKQGALKPFLLALLAGQKEQAQSILGEVSHVVLTAKNIQTVLKTAREFRD